MGKTNLKAIVEGLLFASGDKGVTVKHLAQILETTKISVQYVLDQLEEDYENNERGITIMQAKDVYHLTTKPEHSNHIKKLLDSPQSMSLSQAALETLAIIAYQQPITRVEIEEIRGVNSDGPVQTLLAKSLVEERGRKDAVGRPILFGTSTDFLTYFGFVSLDELPPLPEVLNTDELKKEADLFFEHTNEFHNYRK